ncbi:hypothetical protein [Conexibacter woesei]|uniref:Uncharacterized protein n=1 Tax=Conexibacter woesei (strain DSM 14684 / CCUG 47730 / CIP 108061 / JCM 11494 / NBRC 100937 / ID131577) TaxID=469383 RepID=D3F792_CONWI|nr:hypothetical protein [Conexibacter woesei]ADB48863.1 hypothetical protein Cwoe_0427 [Conexibacter woesei DSM 14684]
MRTTVFRRIAPLAALAAGALILPAAAQAKGSATAVCKSQGQMCVATFDLAGGASRKDLTVRLPDTNLQLVSVTATPAYVEGAYQVYDPSFSLGGSLFKSKLNAVKSIPKGAKLRITFGPPETMLNCGGIHTGVGDLSIIRRQDGPRGAYGCPQAAAVGKTWLKRFNAYQQTESFSVRGIDYRCKVVPFPVNINCYGGGTAVLFSAPSGHN